RQSGGRRSCVFGKLGDASDIRRVTVWFAVRRNPRSLPARLVLQRSGPVSSYESSASAPKTEAAPVHRRGYVDHYNNVRLNSATGYITTKDMLAGRQEKIHEERDRKLEEARKQRQIRRQQAPFNCC